MADKLSKSGREPMNRIESAVPLNNPDTIREARHPLIPFRVFHALRDAIRSFMQKNIRISRAVDTIDANRLEPLSPEHGKDIMLSEFQTFLALTHPEIEVKVWDDAFDHLIGENPEIATDDLVALQKRVDFVCQEGDSSAYFQIGGNGESGYSLIQQEKPGKTDEPAEVSAIPDDVQDAWKEFGGSSLFQGGFLAEGREMIFSGIDGILSLVREFQEAFRGIEDGRSEGPSLREALEPLLESIRSIQRRVRNNPVTTFALLVALVSGGYITLEKGMPALDGYMRAKTEASVKAEAREIGMKVPEGKLSDEELQRMLWAIRDYRGTSQIFSDEGHVRPPEKRSELKQDQEESGNE